jgi:N-acetylmuramoyl-L-alanine amidase
MKDKSIIDFIKIIAELILGFKYPKKIEEELSIHANDSLKEKPVIIKKSASKMWEPTNKRTIKNIVIHCSASPDNSDIGVDEIRHLHTSPTSIKMQWGKYSTTGKGWSDAGYHYVVRRDGTVELGRPEDRAGAHVAGHNANTVGVCWIGEDNPTSDQIESLLYIVRNKIKEYDLKTTDVLGHYELDSSKTCPNLDMTSFRSRI